MQQVSAIILFARTAGAEGKEKNLLQRSGKNNENALRLLRNHAIAVIKASHIPYFIFSEEEQVGESFAAKITNAYQQVFDLGYQRVICISADVPSITSKDLINAERLLLQENVVCGPTQCGGSYLLGINKAVFNKYVFLGLAWRTSNLFRDITNKFAHCAVTKELPELNTAEQLLALKNSSTKFVGISRQLLHLVDSIRLNTIETLLSHFLYGNYTLVRRPARAP